MRNQSLEAKNSEPVKREKMGAKGTISAEKIWNIGNLEEEAWKTEWLIDYIDLNRKVLGAHYSIAGGGPMCAGGGSGYQLAYFGGKKARNTTVEALPTASSTGESERPAEQYLGHR